MGALAVVSSSSGAAADAVRAMLRSAPHRGADLEVHPTAAGALGVSCDSRFPDAWLTSQNGTAAAFVGTLDNADDIRRELGGTGGISTKDVLDPAQILLLAFRRWGSDGFGRFRGSFTAAVLADTTLHCARDQLGLRPLFYRQEAGTFFAATEAKQIVAGAGLAREPDPEAVEQLFYGRLSPETTALRGVSRFPRATVAVARDGYAVFSRYWDPRPLLESADLSPEETRERLAELLDKVIARSVSGNDVVSLSGGIDSPTIAAIAGERHRHLTGRPLQALSSVYPDHPTVDERRYTELVADYLGLPLETYVPTAQPLDDVQKWVDLVDGPVETLSLPELAENYSRARALGARTVLTGEMAEWVFTFEAHLIGHFILHGRFRAAAGWLREQHSYGASWRQVARFVAPSLAPPAAARWYLSRRQQPTGHAPAWIDPAQTGDVVRLDLARPARKRWLEHQLDPLLTPPATSLDADEICAAFYGVQVKRPLADLDLWEFLLSLRAERKFPSSVPKALIRDVMRGRLPDEILDRRDKTGFSAWVLGTADWAGLRRWVADPDPPIGGVDYRLLLDAIDRRQMNALELIWAYDLARVHAFLDLWR